MLTRNELWMIEDIDRQTIHYLLPFIYFETPEKEQYKPNIKRILKYGKQELSTRVDIPFYTKAGYQQYPAETLKKNPNKQYLGYGYYHNLRYSFHYRDQIYAGITAEKDAGEPFFTGQNKKGYDFYSLYLLIRNIGHIKTLALGNYRVSYGYGLVINTDFGMGKQLHSLLWEIRAGEYASTLLPMNITIFKEWQSAISWRKDGHWMVSILIGRWMVLLITSL